MLFIKESCKLTIVVVSFVTAMNLSTKHMAKDSIKPNGREELIKSYNDFKPLPTMSSEDIAIINKCKNIINNSFPFEKKYKDCEGKL